MAQNKLEVELTAKNDQFKQKMTESESVTKTTSEKMTSSLNSFKLAAVAVYAAAGASVLNFAKNAVKAYGVQEDAEKNLESVISATGGAAGLTADEMKRYASELQSVTRYGDEVTISAMAVLATFKSIQGNNFKTTIATAQDLATIMGSDLKGAVLQLGKALEDPITGLGALRESGVSFSESQIAQVKALVAEGDKYNAQLVILKEVQSQFGGAAKAAAETSAGAFEQLSGATSDIVERLGEMIVKFTGINKTAAEFAKILPYMKHPFDTFNAAMAARFNDTLVDITKNSASEAEEIEQLRKVLANLKKDYDSFDAGNPFMFQSASMSKGVGTEFETTVTGGDATTAYKQTTSKINAVAAKLTALLKKQATQRSVDELDIQSKTIEELQSMRDSYGKNLTDTEKAELNAIRGELSSRAMSDLEVDLSLNTSEDKVQTALDNMRATVVNSDPVLVPLEIDWDSFEEYVPQIGSLDYYSAEIAKAQKAVNSLTGEERILAQAQLQRLEIERALASGDYTGGLNLQAASLEELQLLWNNASDAVRGYLASMLEVDASGTVTGLKDQMTEIESVVSSAVTSFATSLGEALSDGSISEDELLKMFVEPLASACQQFGALLIAQGAAMLALESGNPPAMIAAGIALVAIGAALSAALSNVTSSVSGGGTEEQYDTFTGGYSVGTPDNYETRTAFDGTVSFEISGRNLEGVLTKNESYNAR